MTCKRCGFSVEDGQQMPGLDFVLCGSCASVPLPHKESATLGKGGPQYALALEVTMMRLAIEIASSALALGKYEEAKAALALAPAPAKRRRAA